MSEVRNHGSRCCRCLSWLRCDGRSRQTCGSGRPRRPESSGRAGCPQGSGSIRRHEVEGKRRVPDEGEAWRGRAPGFAFGSTGAQWRRMGGGVESGLWICMRALREMQRREQEARRRSIEACYPAARAVRGMRRAQQAFRQAVRELRRGAQGSRAKDLRSRVGQFRQRVAGRMVFRMGRRAAGFAREHTARLSGSRALRGIVWEGERWNSCIPRCPWRCSRRFP